MSTEGANKEDGHASFKSNLEQKSKHAIANSDGAKDSKIVTESTKSSIKKDVDFRTRKLGAHPNGHPAT